MDLQSRPGLAVRGLLRDQRGVTSLEYALLGMLVALAIIIGATTLGGELGAALGNIATAIPASS